jgi:hypothetical protein
MNKLLVGMGIFLSTLVLAQAAQRTYRLVVNGQAQATPAIVVNGKTYVPLEALQKAGAQASLQGDELRVQFIPVGAAAGPAARGQKGRVALQRHLAAAGAGCSARHQPLLRLGAGVCGAGGGAQPDQRQNLAGFDSFQLLDSQDNKLVAASFGEQYTDIPQADGVVINLRFGPNPKLEAIGAPDKLLVNFRPSGGKPALKGFRVFLAE